MLPDPEEVAWFDWLTNPELEDLLHCPGFVPDAREAFDRYGASGTASRPYGEGRHRSTTLRFNGINTSVLVNSRAFT
ncbi:hypothetical protein [Streptomyces sp. NPDC051219]|uniref:hypothetical protein n=1 Tax=Streptomyces sp. NPDC051219 TaxID=3155283 RepID=UPI0034496364